MPRGRLLLSLLALAAACGREASSPSGPQEPAFNASDPTGRWIVVLRDDVVGVQSVADQMARTAGTAPDFVYSASIKGFAARMTDQAAAALRSDPIVRYVEKDGVVSITTTQSPTPSWGLDRIDQNNLPLDNSYTYNNSGAGVHFYGIDTGILGTHNEFIGRMSNGFDAIGGGTTDCNGHGTHTSSNAAGTIYGVAKSMTVHPVRVLNCFGSGTFAQVIAGIDWVTANRVLPAVANMSLGGSFDQATNDAVTRSITNGGVFYSISAGNSNLDACSFSPASTPLATTVAASDISDVRASFSNIGTCVDIFGPGVNITAAWIGSNSATNTISGTSMSAPHVAGAAGLYLAANPGSTPAQVDAALKSNASLNKITNPGAGSPNRLIYMGFIGGGGPGNLPPIASFTWSCTPTRFCTFDGTGSSDPDGTIAAYSWTRPRSSTVISTAASWSRQFPRAMTFTLILTVTDNLGATNSTSQPITVP